MPLVGVNAHTMSGLVSSIIFFQSAKMSDSGTPGRVTFCVCGMTSSRVARAIRSGQRLGNADQFDLIALQHVAQVQPDVRVQHAHDGDLVLLRRQRKRLRHSNAIARIMIESIS